MKNKPRILIVDDEPFNVDYLEQELEDLDYDLITAFNGQAGLEKIRSEKPDLVLLDIMMPIMDGFTVLQAVKADAELRTIPVIIVSANNDLSSVVKGIKMGAEDYLPKPFEPTILRARISSSLERKHLRDLEQMHLKSLQREMDIARDIQKEFLPQVIPDPPGWEIAAYFKAANNVAGDFYDVFTLPDGNLVFIIGDVCGKGIGAALFMTLYRSLLRATTTSSDLSNLSNRMQLSPLDRLEHAVSFTNMYVTTIHADTFTFATTFIGLFDVGSGTLHYINAGNEPPYLVRRDGEMETLKPSGPAIGVFSDAKFSVRESHMEPGEMLIAFTDGIPEGKNPRDEFFGYERLQPLLVNNHPGPSDCLNQIADHLATFMEDGEQFDDITMLAIRRK